VKSTETDTTHLFRTLNNTGRVYKNSVAKEAVAIERRPGGAKFSDIQHLVSGARGKTVFVFPFSFFLLVRPRPISGFG
jgi:hypothetical protein